MNPIDPVGPTTEAASKAAKLVMETAPGAGGEPSVEALTQRFQSMMQGPHHAPASPAAEGQNVVSEVLSRGEEMLHREDANLDKLKAEAGQLSPVELTLKTIELTQQMSVNNFRMQAAVTLTSNANKSVQTLLKNQ